jgi:predicted transcriptional regulator
MNEQPFSGQLRQAIRECGRSRYALSHETGVDQSTLSKFMKGSSLSLAVVDKLVTVLEFELKPKRKGAK